MTTITELTADWAPNVALGRLAPISPDLQRAGLRHFASGVTVVTTKFEGVPFGLTATAVSSVTVDPPRMMVLVNKNVAADAAILASGALCINFLSADQEHLARVFAGMVKEVVGPARFEHGQWREGVTGAPLLADALASFDCRVVKVFDESTHHGLLCEVVGIGEQSGGEPLLYMNGAFRRIMPLES